MHHAVHNYVCIVSVKDAIDCIAGNRDVKIHLDLSINIYRNQCNDDGG
jgi:hypothetical protein